MFDDDSDEKASRISNAEWTITHVKLQRTPFPGKWGSAIEL